MDDQVFINTNFIGVDAIQSFLAGKDSYLQSYVENNRSAAQIIWDASHGYGSASGSINGITIDSTTGTVSPWVIILMLQNEQSLITKSSRDDNALSWAMGYGGTGDPRYSGFTKQGHSGLEPFSSFNTFYPSYSRISDFGVIFNDSGENVTNVTL